MPKAKLKMNGQLSLVEEVYRQSNIDFVLRFLAATLTQVYNKKEQEQQI